MHKAHMTRVSEHKFWLPPAGQARRNLGTAGVHSHLSAREDTVWLSQLQVTSKQVPPCGRAVQDELKQTWCRKLSPNLRLPAVLTAWIPVSSPSSTAEGGLTKLARCKLVKLQKMQARTASCTYRCIVEETSTVLRFWCPEATLYHTALAVKNRLVLT